MGIYINNIVLINKQFQWAYFKKNLGKEQALLLVLV
jgi:hypothetical protein